MKTRNYFASAAAILALLINIPAASADDDETFDAPFMDARDADNPFRDDEPIIIIVDDEIDNPPIDVIDESLVIVVPDDEDTAPPDDEPVYISVDTDNDRILPPSRLTRPDSETAKTKKEKKVKTQDARFVKLAVDDTYTYYLDRQSVAWRRIPYFASEYMADVWIRMIEHNADTTDLPGDLSDYLNDTFSGEIELASAKNRKPVNPVDVEVLQHRKYFLEHYYLRPKTKQIQFLCELEVVGHPQNTVSERQYDYKNWENLIPSSIESIIYSAVLKEIGTSKSTERGHMTFVDMLEEYGRISIR